jgi:hypothetical protein
MNPASPRADVGAAGDRSAWPWLALPSRFVLFAAAQGLIALAIAAGGAPAAWTRSAAWWMTSATVANVVSFLALLGAFRREGASYWDLWRFPRGTFGKDLGLALAGFVLAGPIAMLPMQWLGTAIVGSYDAAIATMFRPLPAWGLWLGLLFPITIAFAELPTYFGYAMPRLEHRLGSGWVAWLLASLALSLQHATLPLVLDGRFFLWRAVMYLPFALYIGLVVKWRPRLLPFLMIGHGLIDVATWAVYFTL